MDSFYIVLTGSLVAICGALLGSFLVLRKATMVGDAISHAVLPGIVLAYWLAQSRASGMMLIGAGIFGVGITILIETLHTRGKMPLDASIGLSFTTLFALGVIMISVWAGQIDLDQDCVLYGEIAYIPLEEGFLGVPSTIWRLFLLLLGILLFVWVGYKGLFLTSFDEVFATSLGISVLFWHYALMSAVSFMTVLAFEAVGAILVLAFLVVPPATAYLITHSLQKMIFLALIFGVNCAIMGYFLAVWLNGSIAGAMATVAGMQFLVVLILKKSVLKD